MNASKQQESIFPVGTRIRFTKTLTCAATGDHPDFLYAQAGDEGEITGHGTKEGYWAKTTYNPPFGVSRDEFEPIELSKQQESEQPYKCEICGKPVPDFVPEFCCPGIDCNCQGSPIHPCVCSQECGDALFAGIGTPMEQRRIAAGISKWHPATPSADEEIERIADLLHADVSKVFHRSLAADSRPVIRERLEELAALLSASNTNEREEVNSWKTWGEEQSETARKLSYQNDNLVRALAAREGELAEAKTELKNTLESRDGWKQRAMGYVNERDSLKAELATAQSELVEVRCKLNREIENHDSLRSQLTEAQAKQLAALDSAECADKSRVLVEEKLTEANAKLAEAQTVLSAKILGHDPEPYVYIQFPATVGHLPLMEWFASLRQLLTRLSP